MATNEPEIPLFLGVSKRAARRGYEWDLLGLSNFLVFPFFPNTINGLQIVLGLKRRNLLIPDFSYRVTLIDESRPENQGTVDQKFALTYAEPSTEAAIPKGSFVIPSQSNAGQSEVGLNFLSSSEDPDSMELFPIPAPPLLLYGPCRILVDIAVGGGPNIRRGEFLCGHLQPPPLTEAERRALASSPGAAKCVTYMLACSKCKQGAAFYLPLDPLAPRPAKLPPNAILISEASNAWECKCGTRADLSYLKLGMQDLLRRPAVKPTVPAAMSFTPLYEAGRIQDTIAEYEHLLETASDEEVIQEYLEGHSLFWAFLSPIRIMHKPPVLTKKKADFGILTRQKILYLVEIEKPTTRLTNQAGGISADIQKGANQIRDWQLVVTDHRLALLNELDLRDTDVQEIRYLLIGGMARTTNAAGLTKLRRTPFAPNTEFYCFDELGSFLHSVAHELHRL